MRVLLSGNEAMARGAYEAGIQVVAGYPGTPSSEILENVSKYKEIYSEWSVNEKVAMDMAAGAAYSGKTGHGDNEAGGNECSFRFPVLYSLYRFGGRVGGCDGR